MQDHIRNFAIIAHIDHGKSTLADRLLEMTGTVAKREMTEQLLDSNPIERERGITIKLAPVRMHWTPVTSNQSSVISNNASDDGLPITDYVLNLIDTPGHVDFSYEVSRSLAACEGALLVVDASQGVQAQTLAHLREGRLHNLTIIPIINKIDLPNARIAETIAELKNLGFRQEEILQISAKTGKNVDQVLQAIVSRIPSPVGDPESSLRALVFSSQYDPHKGVVVFVHIVSGSIYFDPLLKLKFMASGATVAPVEIGYFTPRMTSGQALLTGEVGYIATGLKDVRLAKVGDTITQVQSAKFKVQSSNRNNLTIQQFNNSIIEQLPGYKEPKPMVFLGLFPVAADEYRQAREAMERLRLSDAAFTFKPISSLALGNGFLCGFLGLLHAEVVQERILREFGLTMIATVPSVEYKLKLKGAYRAAPEITIQSAAEYPDPALVAEVKEPLMQVTIYAPKRYVGAIMQLAQGARGEYVDLVYVGDQAQFTYLIPLSEMIVNFFDRLKSVSEGYASLDYEFFAYQPVTVARIDILVNKEKVDALALLIVADQAARRGREIVEKLAQAIPRQQFAIPIQAAIGGQVVARADVKPFRKDVIAKLYGGDRTRKDKLLEAQKKGKSRMKLVGRVEIPQNVFFEVLKRH